MSDVTNVMEATLAHNLSNILKIHADENEMINVCCTSMAIKNHFIAEKSNFDQKFYCVRI